jgi:hypothetical protein
MGAFKFFSIEHDKKAALTISVTQLFCWHSFKPTFFAESLVYSIANKIAFLRYSDDRVPDRDIDLALTSKTGKYLILSLE